MNAVDFGQPCEKRLGRLSLKLLPCGIETLTREPRIRAGNASWNRNRAPSVTVQDPPKSDLDATPSTTRSDRYAGNYKGG